MFPLGVPDNERIQGTWRSVSIETLGYQADEDMGVSLLVFTGDRATTPDGRTYRFRLDPSKDPKELDLLYADTDHALFRGIYRWQGDLLVTCLNTYLSPRPRGFVTSEEASDVLTCFERVIGSPGDSGRAESNVGRRHDSSSRYFAMARQKLLEVFDQLCGVTWLNCFDYYDLTHSVSFHRDGTGRMEWGDGQATKAEFTFEFKLHRPTCVAMKCRDVFDPQSRMISHEVWFTLVEGLHEVIDNGVMSCPVTRLFRFLLCFDNDPFPKGCGRPGASLLYHAGEITVQDCFTA
jgi:uncharacterized protein (TIGR03067 family)